MRRPKLRRSLVPALVWLLALAGCSSVPPPGPDAGREAPGRVRPAERAAGRAGPEALAPEALVVAAARDLLATPYRRGGDGGDGFDCSGLTSHVLARAGVALPRTAEAQAEAGVWIPLDELAPGDLVFFALGGGKPHHVGLVVSEPGQPLTMIHASNSRGVVETVVPRSRYWLSRLRFGRRVLPGR